MVSPTRAAPMKKSGQHPSRWISCGHNAAINTNYLGKGGDVWAHLFASRVHLEAISWPTGAYVGNAWFGGQGNTPAHNRDSCLLPFRTIACRNGLSGAWEVLAIIRDRVVPYSIAVLWLNASVMAIRFLVHRPWRPLRRP